MQARSLLTRMTGSPFPDLPNLVDKFPDPRIRRRRWPRFEFPQPIDQNRPRPHCVGWKMVNVERASRTHDDVVTIDRRAKGELAARQIWRRPQTSASHRAQPV